MIAIVFIVIMAVIVAGASLMGGTAPVAVTVPWWSLLAVLLAFVGFFAGGIYVGAALSSLALLAGFGLSDRPFWNFIGEMLSFNANSSAP
jgi:hypothetical protein